MKRTTAALLSTAFSLAFVPVAAHAQLVTSPPPGIFTQSIDFNSIANCSSFTAGPAALSGGITYTSSTSSSVLGWACNYGLSGNGNWNNFAHAGLNDANGWMRFTFSGPVSAVGAFTNYAPGSSRGVFIRALDQSNNVLDSYDLMALAPINTPGATNGGDFRGIVRSTNDIYALELADGYVVAHDIYWGTGTSVTPEPASMVLFATGLAGLAGAVVRRRRSVVA